LHFSPRLPYQAVQLKNILSHTLTLARRESKHFLCTRKKKRLPPLTHYSLTPTPLHFNLKDAKQDKFASARQCMK
jgi:hypothetical protein